MLRYLTRRRMAPVVILAAAALLLTGCGSAAKAKKPAASPTTPTATPTIVRAGACDFKTGGVSAQVKVTGALGAKNPVATFATGLKSTSLERTVLTPGAGAMTKKGDNLNLVISAYIGRTGKQITSEAAKLKAGDSTLPKSFDAGFDCVPLGSRVVSTFPSSDLYGASGNTQLGIQTGDTLVVITDVVSVVTPLHPAVWKNAPSVTFKGKIPKVTLTGKPDPKLQLHVIKKGAGTLVKAGDSVTVDYLGESWNTKKIFDESYSKTPATFATDQVVQGFGAALVGQKVGTRLIVTIPPVYGYGVGAIGSGNLVGETLVFVIDIRSTKTP